MSVPSRREEGKAELTLEAEDYPLSEPVAPLPRSGTWVAACVDAHHPVLRGRVRARWEHEGRAVDAWLPALASLAIRAGDRLLVTAPSNFDEPVVTGVIDGFTPRPERPSREKAALAMGAGEHITITDAAGNPLVELRAEEAGVRVRLLHGATAVDLPGTLSLRADAIELAARAGDVRVDARGDVRINGDRVRLNGT